MTPSEDFVLPNMTPNMTEDEDRDMFLYHDMTTRTSISLVSWSLIRKASPYILKWRNNFVKFRDDE